MNKKKTGLCRKKAIIENVFKMNTHKKVNESIIKIHPLKMTISRYHHESKLFEPKIILF